MSESPDEDLTAAPYGDAGIAPTCGNSKSPAQQAVNAAASHATETIEFGGGSDNGGWDEDEAGASHKKLTHVDAFIDAILNSAPSKDAAFKALLLLAFYDRSAGQQLDKCEGDVFDRHLAAVLSVPRLKVIK